METLCSIPPRPEQARGPFRAGRAAPFFSSKGKIISGEGLHCKYCKHCKHGEAEEGTTWQKIGRFSRGKGQINSGGGEVKISEQNFI
jgi:hypothetical protein